MSAETFGEPVFEGGIPSGEELQAMLEENLERTFSGDRISRWEGMSNAVAVLISTPR